MRDPREYKNAHEWHNDASSSIPIRSLFSDICGRLDERDVEIDRLKKTISDAASYLDDKKVATAHVSLVLALEASGRKQRCEE